MCFDGFSGAHLIAGVSTIDKGVNLRKFEDSFSLWFCIIALVLVGIVIGVSTSNTSWIAVVSLLSNIVTILGFALALKAYLHWIKQDTVGVQMQLIREIMMEIAELDCYISDLFSQSVLNEAKLMAVKFPTEEQRDVFNKISPKVQDIKLLIRKYYSIEPSPL